MKGKERERAREGGGGCPPLVMRKELTQEMVTYGTDLLGPGLPIQIPLYLQLTAARLAQLAFVFCGRAANEINRSVLPKRGTVYCVWQAIWDWSCVWEEGCFGSPRGVQSGRRWREGLNGAATSAVFRFDCSEIT